MSELVSWRRILDHGRWLTVHSNVCNKNIKLSDFAIDHGLSTMDFVQKTYLC
jgi:hypothetical protein